MRIIQRRFLVAGHNSENNTEVPSSRTAVRIIQRFLVAGHNSEGNTEVQSSRTQQ